MAMADYFGQKDSGRRPGNFPRAVLIAGEKVEDALYRELYEEVGLESGDVSIIQRSKKWLRYHIPQQMQRKHSKPLCIGQKQRWFFLQMNCDPGKVRFDTSGTPEFDDWQWVNYWYPVNSIISFKRTVYRNALQEFSAANARLQTIQQKAV